jgi:uncharacterized protein YlzI (FlbEa/FlbD family)
MVVIQKINALFQKIPFRFGIIVSGIYKGYYGEIVDLTSTNTYVVSVNFFKINLNPDQIIPEPIEKSKINKELQDLMKYQEYKENEVAQEIISVTQGNVDILYELFKTGNKIGKNFLVLIFEKIKKQFDDEVLDEPQYQEEEQIDYEATFEQIVNLNQNVAEYLDDPVSHSLLMCANLLQLNNSSNFVNSHSIEIQNREPNIKNYFRSDDLHLLITAYLFVFLNQLGGQIDTNLLNSLSIRIRPNDNPETIIKLLEFFDYIKKNKEEKIIDYIMQLEKLDGLHRIHPTVIKRRVDFVRKDFVKRKSYKQADYLVLLPLEVKKAIEEPIKFYLLQKVRAQIRRTKCKSQNSCKSQRISGKSQNKELKERQKMAEVYVYNKIKNGLKNGSKIPKSKSKSKSEITHKGEKELVRKMIEQEIKRNNIKTRSILEHFLKNFDNLKYRYTHIGNPEYLNVIDPYIKEYQKLIKVKSQEVHKIDERLNKLLSKLHTDTKQFIKESTQLTKQQKDYLLTNFDKISKGGKYTFLIKDNIQKQIYTQYILVRLKIINAYNRNTMKINMKI